MLIESRTQVMLIVNGNKSALNANKSEHPYSFIMK